MRACPQEKSAEAASGTRKKRASPPSVGDATESFLSICVFRGSRGPEEFSCRNDSFEPTLALNSKNSQKTTGQNATGGYLSSSSVCAAALYVGVGTANELYAGP